MATEIPETAPALLRYLVANMPDKRGTAGFVSSGVSRVPSLLQLASHVDPRGSLTVLEREVPFPIRRVFVIHGVPGDVRRGGHRHKRTRQALVCIGGSCIVDCQTPAARSTHRLDRADRCLLVEPEDFHWMHSFSPGAVLVVLASEPFDRADYVHEAYDAASAPADPQA